MRKYIINIGVALEKTVLVIWTAAFKLFKTKCGRILAKKLIKMFSFLWKIYLWRKILNPNLQGWFHCCLSPNYSVWRLTVYCSNQLLKNRMNWTLFIPSLYSSRWKLGNTGWLFINLGIIDKEKTVLHKVWFGGWFSGKIHTIYDSFWQLYKT